MGYICSRNKRRYPYEQMENNGNSYHRPLECERLCRHAFHRPCAGGLFSPFFVYCRRRTARGALPPSAYRPPVIVKAPPKPALRPVVMRPKPTKKPAPKPQLKPALKPKPLQITQKINGKKQGPFFAKKPMNQKDKGQFSNASFHKGAAMKNQPKAAKANKPKAQKTNQKNKKK